MRSPRSLTCKPQRCANTSGKLKAARRLGSRGESFLDIALPMRLRNKAAGPPGNGFASDAVTLERSRITGDKLFLYGEDGHARVSPGARFRSGRACGDPQ